MREAFLKRLLSKIKCSVCGQGYEVADIKILGHEGTLWLFSACCSLCQTQGLLAVVAGRHNAAETATDFVEAERDKFDQSEVVEINDVLDMHNFLKGFNGGFADVFS